MRKFFLLISLVLFTGKVMAQETFPVNDVKDKRAGAYALTNATVYVDHNTKLDNATVLIREGKIERVATGVNVPTGYIEVNLEGKFVYPSFIDPYTSYGLPKVERGRRGRGPEQIQSKKSGAYNANQAIQSENAAAEMFHVDTKTAGAMRKQGFGAVLTFHPDGIARGSSALVSLADGVDNKSLIKEKVATHYSFSKGTSTQSYPSSPMGSIALLRQTYLDASWYKASQPDFVDQSLVAFNDDSGLPQVFEANSWMTVLRADKIGDEFGKQYIITSGGDDYQRIQEIKSTNAQLILPLNFPDAYDVEDAFDSEAVSLDQMKHWEMAPSNPKVVAENGITFAFTSKGLSPKNSYLKQVRKAVEYGLSKADALKAMTSSPAQMLGMQNQMGSLKSGALANMIVTSGDLFEDKTEILQNWIQGKKYHFKALEIADHAGKYRLKVQDHSLKMVISGDPGKQKAKVHLNDSTSVDAKAKIGESLITLNFSPGKDSNGDYQLSGWKQGNAWVGEGLSPSGEWIEWNANFTGTANAAKKKAPKKDAKEIELGELIYPFVAHGTTTLPTDQSTLIKNATVWTNEDQGVLENTDVFLNNGKITQVGKGLNVSADLEIDGTGMHLTAGIVDEHSHIGASSINDVATNSSMVRIGDVIDSEDIGIYQALSGGVTAIQILHGSANPIGGQSALIKLRWGESPENLKIKGADEYIKFALGENVKRSRSSNSIRYPQTRMGVEQVFVDAFTNGKEYRAKWDAYNSLSAKVKASSPMPRRDLALEAMGEILNAERFISCHSYVQSEINMLMHVADQFDFRINTFTHILEGYKVADKMKEHGVGASTFSDWWGYKWEVRYAIPYNAAIMHNEGVLTAINSDDAEMMRRLNQEAAKSIKYGGMEEEDALKMVTLNPAKLLHLEDRMGSIKIGKDADVVLWTDHPLSIYARANKTIIDGKIYFDADKEADHQAAIAKERSRLIAKMRSAKKGGAKAMKPSRSSRLEFNCDTVLDENFSLHLNEQH